MWFTANGYNSTPKTPDRRTGTGIVPCVSRLPRCLLPVHTVNGYMFTAPALRKSEGEHGSEHAASKCEIASTATGELASTTADGLEDDADP